MPEIKDYKDFQKYWNEFFNLCNINIYTKKSIIKIIEKEKSGKGEIYLEFKNLNDKNFVIEILTSAKNNSCCINKKKNCDGILLNINVKNKNMNIYLIELKTTLTSKIEEANEQIRNAYWFISSFNLFKCFDVHCEVILAYRNFNKTNLLNMRKNIDIRNTFKNTLYSFDETSKFPIMLPFCKYIELNVELLEFNTKKVV
ncbi:1-deoxy-D-xylulose 5-phosphate reductoisomerase [Caminibacter mediatlanticus TB-2]|uniref:1-deoxy-D-xylulose 5-phosphate reductoisomerase n=2 Tax=Caminibacter mediatlanticus TaxID=291048 RepID=A0AAI9AGJ7_9BACT|nr:1-deoxy-D-xylulose 5-phosphate reductoisomerase [Caminibacter mediatlanticus TB-2]